MLTRRDVIKNLARLFLLSVATTGFWFSKIPTAIAEIKKRILSKDTDPKSLRNEDPQRLDTRNLKIMPLEAFETMGDKDIFINPEVWRLQLTGAIVKPIQFTYKEILDLPSIEREVLLICPGVFANHGSWKGISIQELMKKTDVTIKPSKIFIYGRSHGDDRKEQFKIDEIKMDKVFLAYAVNGQKLPLKHGSPLRVVAEDHFGSEWVKYVYKIEIN